MANWNIFYDKQQFHDQIESNSENEYQDQIADEAVTEQRQQRAVCLLIREETHVLVPCVHGNLAKIVL